MTDAQRDAQYPSDLPWVAIAPMRMEFVESYHACLDTVCREGRYLMSSCAPELEKSRQFVASILKDQMPMFVALAPGPTVIGWCDVYRKPHECQDHVGTLGMGIHANYREQGLGSILIERVLKKALTAGLERVELDVFADNSRALALYQKFGFEVEGKKRRARKTRHGYQDIICMGKIIRTRDMPGVSSSEGEHQ